MLQKDVSTLQLEPSQSISPWESFLGLVEECRLRGIAFGRMVWLFTATSGHSVLVERTDLHTRRIQQRFVGSPKLTETGED